MNAIIESISGKNVNRASSAIVGVLSEKSFVGVRDKVLSALVVKRKSAECEESISSFGMACKKCSVTFLAMDSVKRLQRPNETCCCCMYVCCCERRQGY